MTTIKPEELESAQVYDHHREKPQEVFSCEDCGETMTELEHSKNSGMCYGCRQENKHD